LLHRLVASIDDVILTFGIAAADVITSLAYVITSLTDVISFLVDVVESRIDISI